MVTAEVTYDGGMNAPPPPQPASPIVINLLFIGCFIAGLAIVVVGAMGIVNEGALGDGALPAQARVTDTRIMTSTKSGDSFELRYAFDVDGQTYTYRDETGREDLWASVTHEAWVDARNTGSVHILYLPSDPWVSQPRDKATSGIFDKLAGMCVGFFCMAPAFLWVFGAIKRRRASATG